MRWIYAENKDIDEHLKSELKDKLNLPDYMIKSFVNRGIDSFEKVREVFEIDSAPLYPPSLFEDMDKTVARIEKAIRGNEKIVIYGDYDVDGVTSIVELYLFFKNFAKYNNIDFYIPHRQDEGYGLNIEALDAIISEGAKLIISVDCGISADKEVDYCGQKGVDIIITDHHIPEEGSVPKKAFAIINPKYSQKYPEKELSGAGVAYKLVCALADRMKIDIKNELIDFAAMGTIADIVPLTYENRIIARRGFKQIAKTTNIGLKALKEAAAIKPDAVISAYHVGFILGPRINAAGRLEHAKKAVELFISNDAEEARMIAEELNNTNEERKSIMNKTHAQAMAMLKDKFDEDNDFVIALYDPGWNAGIVGLVASKVLREYNRPVFILTKSDDGLIHGSARSVSSVDIFEAIKASHGCLVRYGGHKLAAGVTMKDENLQIFIKTVNDFLKASMKKEDFEPSLHIDDDINETINIKDIKVYDKLQPWGAGNRKPVFSLTGVEVRDVKLMKSNTMKFYAKHKERYYNFLLFGHSEEDASTIKAGQILDVAFTPTINTWKGDESLVLEVEDYKL
jgi:single-stranded-DNA-specific exonuclease